MLATERLSRYFQSSSLDDESDDPSDELASPSALLIRFNSLANCESLISAGCKEN